MLQQKCILPWDAQRQRKMKEREYNGTPAE